MTIDPVTGLIQWTPTAEGSFNVSVTADNAVGSDTQSYSITVIILPDIPALIEPVNLTVIADKTPTFIWSATAGVGGTYTLQYSTSSDFSTGVVEWAGLVDTTFTVGDLDSLPDGVWLWRVEAIDQLARESGYQPSPFVFTLDSKPPPVPILQTPVDQAVINDNTPALDWLNPSLITVTYTLEYSSDSLFGSSVVVNGLTASEFTISIPLADGDYFWHVSATKSTGVSSGFQAVPFKFTVNSAAPAVPILLTPPHQTFTTYVTPRFSWLDVQPPLTAARASGGHSPAASMASVTFTLQYSTDSSFATYTEVTGIPDTFYVIPDSVPLAVTTWYWRVEKVDGAGNQSGFQSAYELGLFMPGDQVMDLGVTAADVIWLVNYVFKAGLPPLPCEAAGDVNCSGAVSSADIIHLVNYVFKSGESPCEIGDLIADGTWDCP